MKIAYKNKKLESVLIVANISVAVCTTAAIVALYGFDRPLVKPSLSLMIMIAAFAFFLLEKIVRLFNCVSKKQFIETNWFELPLFVILILAMLATKAIFGTASIEVRILILAVYLVIELLLKAGRTAVAVAASGKNPTIALIGSFLVIIVTGACLLMLPQSYNCRQISAVDALFTATSATCVTGLIVKDTGQDFSFAGQIIILTLIQLGGLGIVIFGAVFALLLGQALSVSESVAMRDLLNEQTLGKISRLIGFIFVVTILIEAAGAAVMYPMWQVSDNAVSTVADAQSKWFCSIFHSISAFCNAGFGLFSNSLIDYNRTWQVYGVFIPLIILGGLGFGVLYNIFELAVDRIRSFFSGRFSSASLLRPSAPVRMRLQSKIVLLTSAILIVAGTAAVFVLEKTAAPDTQTGPAGTWQGLGNALFQSVTARTAGFNTVDISAMTPAGKSVLIILMFIGGSPGSTAGGIKTITLAVIVMIAAATLRKRPRVELFKRSVPLIVLGRAITVTLLFAATLLTVSVLLSVTEKNNDAFAMGDIVFETASALGTVGLSTGITPTLTTAGKLIIIITMLIGRLGPLTLLAAMTFNIRPAVYEYPTEPLIVG